MERSDFFKKMLASGLACGCALRLQAGQAFSSVAPSYGNAVSDAETPCDKKIEFTQAWVKRFMDVLDQNLDGDTCRKLMQTNGSLCAKGAYGELEPSDPRSVEEIDTIIAGWQKNLGKENIRREGNTVFFNYVGNPKGLKIADGYCLCPMIENGPAKLSPTYCQCSVGYVQYMFQKLITGKPVRVELLESLRGGGTACRFKVTL